MRKFTVSQFTTAIVVAALFSCFGGLNGQGINEENPNAVVSPVFKVERSGVVNLQDKDEDWGPFFKTVEKIHVPGLDHRKDRVIELKEEANRLKADLLKKGQLDQGNLRVTGNPPTLGVNYYGNTYDGGDPADNTIAVSAAGSVLSATNSRIHCYDSTGAVLGTAKSLFAFANAGGISTNFTFDPKVTYDPIADRFIVAFLNGSSPSNSKIIVGFSQTNNPSGSYNVYSLNGNVNSMGVWTDFIQLGISTQELFITGNPFAGTASRGAAIWQINKNDGYSGAALTTVVRALSGSFSIHPVEGGSTLYGPKMYFIESELGTGNSIALHQITNTIGSGGVLNSPLSFTMSVSYAIPPDADQPNTTNNLKTNDTRVQSSYFENNRIEFALNTASSGRAGLFYGTGIISPVIGFSAFDGQILGIPGLDLAYGSVAYGGQQAGDGTNHTYLAFNFCGASNFPSCGAVYYDENGPSPHVTVKAGVAPVFSGDRRWGDYADCQERAGKPGEVWAVGTMGNGSNQQRTYIGQLFPPQPVSVARPVAASQGLQVYPNPTTERVTFSFPVDVAGEYRVVLRDLQGRVVKVVIEDYLALGKAELAFNTSYVASGSYFVSVENENRHLFGQRLVVQH